MLTVKIVRAALILALLSGPGFAYAADEPPPGAPAAPEAPKPLEPGVLGLEPFVGPVDNAVDNGKAAISKAIGIDISGFVDTSYTWSSNRPRHPAIIGGRYFDKDQNQLIFNDFNITIDKPEKDWGIGFHIVGDFGRSAQLLRAATLWGSKLHHESGAELREAYLTFTLPLGEGLAVKAGKFVTPLGTETLLAPGAYNENISRSFAFNFAVPLTHTGALFTYPFAKIISASAGIVTGWDDPNDNNNSPSFLGGVNFTPVDAFALASNVVIGREWSAPALEKPLHDGGTRFTWSNVATIKPFDPLTLYLEYTLGHEENALTPVGNRNAWWHAFEGIASYSWTDRFTTALRAEAFLDPQGARTGGLQSTTSIRHVNLAEATITAAYKFTAKLLGRAEVRQDWADRAVFKHRSSGADGNQTTFAFQGLYTF